MSVETVVEPTANRTMVLVSMMLAVVMTILDQTIANVALPHMAGSVQASPDQISWVLTSYIIAAAIQTPTNGWLSNRFGRKQVFLVSIVGFTITSAMCGAAQSLGQIVLFRVLQGAFGASLTPMSQAWMMDSYPIEQRGPIMGIWSVGLLTAPIMGPVLGGWLTDTFNWRWVFYINVPVGIISALGVYTFMRERANPRPMRFDFMGFGLLSITLAAFQLFIDRGQNNDWFQSRETTVEAAVAGVALLLFLIHTLTAKHPFVPPALFKDRNFATATGLAFVVGLGVFPVLALLPPMTQTLLGYPAMTAGLVQMPRGLGNILTVLFVGRMIGRVDTRLMITFGLTLFAISFWGMSHFNLQMGPESLAWTAMVQGTGISFVFLPIINLAFATLPASLRGDGAGVFTLVRNLANAAGISVMEAMFVRNAQIVHARLTETLTADNPLARPFLRSAQGLLALNEEVTRQASMVSYVDVFYFMFWITVPVIPIVLLLRKPRDQLIDADPLPVE